MSKLDENALLLAANTLRCLAADEVQAANSGHPGVALGLADVVACLWLRHLKVCGADPTWADRDRFVMSGGHASSLLYAVLHLAGFELTLDDLRQFRQLGARTPGHPEFGVTPGVETTTGPLGQGIAAAVGMAVAERMLAARLNAEERTVVDHRTWVTCGDGDSTCGADFSPEHEVRDACIHYRCSKKDRGLYDKLPQLGVERLLLGCSHYPRLLLSPFIKPLLKFLDIALDCAQLLFRNQCRSSGKDLIHILIVIRVQGEFEILPPVLLLKGPPCNILCREASLICLPETRKLLIRQSPGNFIKIKLHKTGRACDKKTLAKALRSRHAHRTGTDQCDEKQCHDTVKPLKSNIHTFLL